MTQEGWQSFFGKDYLKFSEAILTPERTDFEIERISNLLNLKPGASILDLGCGQGRISIGLAQRGYNVTGYDGSAELLASAKLRAEAADVQITFVHGDMRELNVENQFDAIINVGTAFGYVEDSDGDQLVLHNVFRALKTGGRFLQETENRDYKLQGLRNTWDEMNGYPVFSSRTFDVLTGRWIERISWFEGSEMKRTELNIRLYAVTELLAMTKLSGLHTEHVYGGFDGAELKFNSPRLLILSRKEQ